MDLSAAQIDLGVERAVIGGLLLDAESIHAVAEVLRPEDFASPLLARAYAAMLALRANATHLDAVTVRDQLEERGQWDDAMHRELLHAAATVPSSAGVLDYARAVARNGRLREIRRAALCVQHAVETNDGIDEALRDLRATLERRSATTKTAQFRTIDELAEEEAEQADWIVEGLAAPGQLTLVASDPKLGKSTLIFAVLAALEAGRAFCELKTKPATAVYLSEESAKTIRQKARRFGLREATFVTRRDAYPRRPLAAWIADATGHALESGASILVLDTLTFWAALKAEAEKDSGAMQEVADVMLAAAAAGLAVIVIHHTRKAPGSNIEKVRGSNALTGAADIIVTLSSGDQPTDRVLAVAGRDEESAGRLVVRLTEDGYERVDRRKEQGADLRSSVLTALANAPADGMKQTDLIKGVTGRKEFVLKVLADLEEEGFLKKLGTGKRGSPLRWRLTEKCRSRSAPTNRGAGTENDERPSNRDLDDEQDSGALLEEGDSVPDHDDLGGGTGTESDEVVPE